MSTHHFWNCQLLRMVCWYFVSWMQEGRKCIFVILQEKQFCAQIFFVFHCFLTSYFFHKDINSFELRPALWLKMCHFTCSFKIYKEHNFTQNVTYDLLAFTWRFIIQNVYSRNFWLKYQGPQFYMWNVHKRYDHVWEVTILCSVTHQNLFYLCYKTYDTQWRRWVNL